MPMNAVKIAEFARQIRRNVSIVNFYASVNPLGAAEALRICIRCLVPICSLAIRSDGTVLGVGVLWVLFGSDGFIELFEFLKGIVWRYV